MITMKSLPTEKLSRQLRWLTVKALCKYLSNLGVERLFCYLGLHKKNL